MLVARGLGPEQYGTMVFLLATFTACVSYLMLAHQPPFLPFCRNVSAAFGLLKFISLGLGCSFS